MDFYVILGVVPQASAADIKRAYRRLARRYHPGINPGDPDAEALFHRVTEAYETLIDPRRRQQYDASGGRVETGTHGRTFEFTEFDFSANAHGPQAATFSELFADVLHPALPSGQTKAETGHDLNASLSISFAESMTGVERQVIVTRQVVCSPCSGSGRLAVAEGRCRHCHATGKIRWARGHMVFSKGCSACGGTGRQRFEPCGVCGGQGRGVRSEAVAVKLPPGTTDGMRVRIAGRGHSGRHGGTAGDLYVRVEVQPHPLFDRDGDDISCEVPLAVHEAVLGARIEVPTLEGSMPLQIPPGTQGGQRFRVKRRGAPRASGGRGDFVVQVKLVLPAVVDERSKELMREFGERNKNDVRKEGEVEPHQRERKLL